MRRYLSKNRSRLDADLQNVEVRKYFSATTLGLYESTTEAINDFVFGSTIDLGCGDMPYKDVVLKKGASYESLDVEQRVSGVTHIGDIQKMTMIRDSRYNTALCLQVLEHVRDPQKTLNEIKRILTHDGILILTVPHLSRLHEEPHDYYRYTKHGLRHLLESSGFSIERLKVYGGIFSFLGHQFSSFFVLTFWGIPVIKKLVYSLNKWLIVKTCYNLDKIFDKKKIFALGYVVVAKK